MIGRLALLTATLLALVIGAPAAALGATVDEIVDALDADRVYVDPTADPGMTENEADRLRGAIDAAGAGPVHVAVLPEQAIADGGGTVEALLQRLVTGVGREGTYAVVAGGRFRASSSGTPDPAVVASLADQAFAARRADGVAAVLTDFVRRLGQRAAGRTPSLPSGPLSAPVSETRRATTGSQTSIGLGALVLPLLLVGGGVLLVRSMLRRRVAGVPELEYEDDAAPTRASTDVLQLARQDVLDLGSDIYALDPEVQAPDADPRAVATFREAVQAYDQAEELVQAAQTSDDLAAVTETIERGRYGIAATRALLAGEDPPPRRPPCFFDPRHGPSVQDVEWAPPGGAPRLVPACARDVARVEAGVEPETRELEVDGQRMPYWQAPARYGPWAGGWFGGFGGTGLLTGLLLGGIGTMVVGGMFDADDASAADGGWGDGDGDYGGDMGGGDFGGDVGGGDFGGDVGGGDF